MEKPEKLGLMLYNELAKMGLGIPQQRAELTEADLSAPPVVADIAERARQFIEQLISKTEKQQLALSNPSTPDWYKQQFAEQLETLHYIKHILLPRSS